jgi:hypothetical protein
MEDVDHESTSDVVADMRAFYAASPSATVREHAFCDRLERAHKRELAQVREYYVCSKHDALRVWEGPEEGARRFVCSFCGEEGP